MPFTQQQAAQKKKGARSPGPALPPSLSSLLLMLGVTQHIGLAQTVSMPQGHHGLSSQHSVSFVEVAAQAGVAGPSEGNGHGAVWADFNNDGRLDLCFTRKEFRNFLFLNNGDGTFYEQADTAGLNTRTQERIRGITVADYDNDGDVDIFMCAGIDDILYRNEGGLVFTDVTDTAGVRNPGNGLVGTWGDYDGDGFVDLYVANWDAAPHALYHNNGNGTFSEVTAPAGLGDDAYNNIGLWFDYDNDGDADLFVSRWNEQPQRLWRNNGDGTFNNVATQAGLALTVKGQGVALADYNNDGWLDIYLASDLGANLLFRNNGDGTFTEMAAAAGVDDDRRSVDCAWGDFDADGSMDLYVGNYDAPSALYFNNGDGTFSENSGPTASRERTIGTTSGDYDGDGWLDFFALQSETPGKLYRNAGNANHWLQIQLQGVHSNRSAIGAQVEIRSAGRRLVQEISGGSGYCSQNSLVLYFGLAGATQANQISIRWPAGGSQTLENIAADQFLKIIEGQPTNPTVVRLISNLVATPISSSAVAITWQTDRPCDSQVEYGLTDKYGTFTSINSAWVTYHRLEIYDLQPATTYYFRVRARDQQGKLTVGPGASFTLSSNNALPDNFRLSESYPNPFTPQTQWNLALAENGELSATIFDVHGQPVRLWHEQLYSAGSHVLEWEGTSSDGRKLSSGIYFLQVNFISSSGRHETATRKIMLRK